MKKVTFAILVIGSFVDLFSQTKPALPAGRGASPIITPNSLLITNYTYAVVVGISDYQDGGIPDLRFADKDAEAFANYLRSNAGGKLDNDHLKVLINENATMAQFANALDWLWEVCKEGDQAIIYFSGHGDVEKKSLTQPGFLLCWDAPSRVYMAGGAFALPMLQEVISTLSVQNKAKVIVITDACRSGTLAGSSVGGSQITGANLAKQYANEIKILSCQPNEYSIEGEQWGGGRGAFSYNLVNALYGMADQNNDLIVNLQEVGRYLEDHVTEEVAPVNQMPMILGNRSEQLANVDAKLLTALKKGKSNQQTLLSSIDSRGIEVDVLTKVDTSIRLLYRLFNQALKDKLFLEPKDKCADAYYEKLIAEPKLERLHSTMLRNYAAALQDDAQQVMNKWLKTSADKLLEASTGSQQVNMPQKVFTEKVRSFPGLLNRAAGLLGKDNFMYAILQARRNFFEGYLLANSDRNPNRELGEIALAAFRQALHWQAELPQTYWQMSNVYGYNLLQPDSAEVYTRKAIELNPLWVIPYTDLAYMYSKKYKEFDRGKLWLEKAIQLDSNSLVVQNGWGLYFANNKEYLKAEQFYKKAIQLDSTHISAFGNLGNLYCATHHYSEGEKFYKKVIQLDSTDALAYNHLGVVYNKTRRYSEAEQLFKKAIQLDSTNAPAYINMGSVFLSTRRYVEAEQLFKKAIQIDSSMAMTYNHLGVVYNKTRRYSEAEQLFKKAIQLDSTNAPAYINLGIVYTSTHRFVEAEQQYKKVIQLDSTDISAYYNLSCFYSQQNQIEVAFGYFEKALKLGYNNYDWMQKDSDLAPIREQKEKWDALMKKYFPEGGRK